MKKIKAFVKEKKICIRSLIQIFLRHSVVFATIVMAITSVLMWRITLQSRAIQMKGLEISEKLGNLQEKANTQNLIRLQSELRPYLIPNLRQNPPYFTIDNQSIMTFVPNNGRLPIQFGLSNVGVIPARNIRAKYDSPDITNYYFDLAENVILPQCRSQRYWTPAVNIQTVINTQKKEPFEVALIIEYDGNEDIDNRKYISQLKLKIQKDVDDKYKIINQYLNFQFKEK